MEIVFADMYNLESIFNRILSLLTRLLDAYNQTDKRHYIYRCADKSLARPGRKQARKHVRDAPDFNNIETRAVIIFFPLQGKAPKETHAILTETLACFIPGGAKDLSPPLHIYCQNIPPARAYCNYTKQIFLNTLFLQYR